MPTQNLSDTTALLSRTPTALESLLRGLPGIWTEHNEGLINGEETWTVHQVLGHLIHTEHNNWLPRVKWLLEFGERQPLAPVDRHASYDRPVEALLQEFAQARSESLDDLKQLHLTADDLNKRGIHPKFGIVTLSQLLATWTVHDLTHLHQISRIMAHQYREAVGPWIEFLGVLQCNGHSTF